MPRMNRRDKRAGRRSRKQREAAVSEVEGRQFSKGRFVDRALFIWTPVVMTVVAVLVVIIYLTR
ncbi:MAG: hypothetical protein HQ478_01130 [Chloroflexi bacterium]|nr:hypothetical protein [Chloroflexota bacterium]